MLTKIESPLKHPSQLLIAIAIALLLPYALFGKHKKTARWIALINGVQISLTCVFFEPLFLIFNPFLALFALSPIWKKIDANRKHKA